MNREAQRKWAVLSIVLLVAILPAFVYWLAVGRVPAITASEAIRRLEAGRGEVILIDVRDEASYQRERVDGAEHFPLAAVRDLASPAELPASWQGKELLVICSGGLESVAATRHLLALGHPNVQSVRGGMQEWSKAGVENPDAAYSYFVSQNTAPYLIAQPMSTAGQAMQLVTGLVIKPIHMILSALLIWILFRATQLDMTLARWALVALLVGEAFCALNFLLFQDNSLLAEHLHNVGMIISFTLVGWAAIEGLETRVLKLGVARKPCAIVSLCGKCDKLQGGQCKARQLFQWMLLAVAVLTLIPITVAPDHGSLSSWIFGTPYFYSELFIFQLFEARWLPAMAILFFAVSWWRLRRDDSEPIPELSRIFMAAGLGALGFGVFRLALHFLFERQPLWFSFWEEATELLFVAMVALVLWIFRQRLLGADWTLRAQFHLGNAAGAVEKR